MKNALLFPKKKTWRARLDLEYLDETSERKASARRYRYGEQEACEAGVKLKQFAHYASKEKLGQVHAGGFLHHLIIENLDGTRTAPSQLSNDERKKRISSAWLGHLRHIPTSSENPVLQHRLVFSMSTDLHDRLVYAGLNPDRVLQITTKKIMGQFADRFHPGDSIGYAYGIHHDTDNLHVHVALCPRTAKGAYVGCSTSRGTTSGNKKQMDYLRKCFLGESQRWGQILSSPEIFQEQINRREDRDQLVFAPKIVAAQLEALRKRRTFDAMRLRQMYEKIQEQEKAIAERRQQLATMRNVRFAARMIGRRKSVPEKLASAAARSIQRNSLRLMQDELFLLKKKYRAEHKRYLQQNQPDTTSQRHIQQDFLTLQHQEDQHEKMRERESKPVQGPTKTAGVSLY